MSFRAYIANIEAATGKPIHDIVKTAEQKGFAEAGVLTPGTKAGQIIEWLKADFGLGHGHSMAIVAYLKGKRE